MKLLTINVHSWLENNQLEKLDILAGQDNRQQQRQQMVVQDNQQSQTHQDIGSVAESRVIGVGRE